MTIPIIPGPFSFLTSAGQAAGAIGSALTERDRYRKELALRQQAAAQANIGILQRILAPEAFAQGGSAAPLVTAAGIPDIKPADIEVPGSVAIGRRQKKELDQLPVGSRQSQITSGVATEGQAAQDEAQQQEAETAIRALAEIVSPEQLRQYKHLLSPTAAKVAENLFLEKAQTELQQQDPLRVEAKMQSDIRSSVIKRLPRDPLFSKVADYAAVGGLGYLLQDLENQVRFVTGRQALNTEKIRLVVATTNQAAQAYRQARAQWEAGLAKTRTEALGIEGSTLSQQEKTKKLNETDADYTQRNPMPNYDQFLQEALSSAGLDQGDFQQAFRELTHVPNASAGTDANLQKVIQMYQNGDFTDADIDASTKLTAAQKAQIKASKRKP